MSRWADTKKRPTPRIEEPGVRRKDYFEDFVIGAGAGAAFGQQETASKDAAAARMASLAIFIMICQVWCLSCGGPDNSGQTVNTKLASIRQLASPDSAVAQTHQVPESGSPERLDRDSLNFTQWI